jgi:hypothetical protein
MNWLWLLLAIWLVPTLIPVAYCIYVDYFAVVADYEKFPLWFAFLVGLCWPFFGTMLLLVWLTGPRED